MCVDVQHIVFIQYIVFNAWFSKLCYQNFVDGVEVRYL